MYPYVCKWLKSYLEDRHQNATIKVFDTSRKSLAKIIKEKSLFDNLPSEWQTWDIYVDVIGFVLEKSKTHLAFVECKNISLTLAHLSQLLGYSRVAHPKYSFLISPQGLSNSLLSLLLTYNRLDILDYHKITSKIPFSLIIAKWDETANNIDTSSVISGDRNFLGRL